MKKNRFLKFSLFVIMLAVIFITYKYYSISTAETMSHIIHEPILLNEKDKIHFFKDGFVISGSSSRFFKPDGTAMPSPIPGQADTISQHIVNMSTPSFMLLDGKSIFKTLNTPFEKLYELDIDTGYGIKEFDDYIVILALDETGILVPKLYDLKQNILLDIRDIESLYYMDSAFDSESNSLSILALSLDTPFPSSKVFNYTGGGTTLFSVISIKESYFKILRIPSHVILVGTHEILCYNIDGTLQWSIENKKINSCTIVENESGYMFYFPQPIDNGDNVFFNALKINSDGTYNKLDFPKNLVDLQPYKNSFIALHNGRNILVLNESGTIEQEFYITEDIISLYYSKYHKDYLYLLDRDNQLHIYSIKKEDSQQ